MPKLFLPISGYRYRFTEDAEFTVTIAPSRTANSTHFATSLKRCLDYISKTSQDGKNIVFKAKKILNDYEIIMIIKKGAEIKFNCFKTHTKSCNVHFSFLFKKDREVFAEGSGLFKNFFSLKELETLSLERDDQS